jgi:hypothetical protein
MEEGGGIEPLSLSGYHYLANSLGSLPRHPPFSIVAGGERRTRIPAP